MGLLRRARPDRDGAKLEMTALPAEGLRLGPGPEDQLHPLGGALTRLVRVEAEGQILPGDAAQHPDHQPARHQIVEHRELLGDLHRVALRHDRAEHRDLDLLRVRRQMRGRDDRAGCEALRRVVMLGDAEPVETERLDVLQPLDHAAIGLRPGFAVVGIGRHRPFGRQLPRRKVARGLEIRDLHGCEPRVVKPRECAAGPSRQRARASASSGRYRARRGSGKQGRARRPRPPRGTV